VFQDRPQMQLHLVELDGTAQLLLEAVEYAAFGRVE